ncbi:DUF349 domain-containing protein [Parabacteroides sp. OttesenSCG-928-G07]|nr:DUF349 domain-containing protein [Parabacteroides sp. OttesenSCG-928-G07]
MTDTHDTNLPEENGKLEETKAPVEPVENGIVNVETKEEPIEETAVVETSEEPKAETAEPPASEQEEVKAEEPEPIEETALETPAVPEVQKEAEPAEPKTATPKLTKEEITNRLSELLNDSIEAARNEIESLKQSYYKIRRAELDELKKAFIENGGAEADFVAPEDEVETKIKELLAAYKEKRASILAEEERVKAANYALKLQLIDQLKVLLESQDDFNKLYNEFKDIQQRWKEVKAVPQEHANELWKKYQIYSEKFYDLIKINNQFRDYDFKKNLEMKTALCETVEKLQEEADIISVFHQLQNLHQQWREIGPVAKEQREEIWTRFKIASTIINKRHQEHFEKQKAKEQENLTIKIEICEQIEALDYDSLKSFKDWEAKTREVMALQERWKTIGYAPRKHNIKIFERFRAACDNYFNKKTEFYKLIKSDLEKNYAEKKALCEQAEALKDSTDWKDTTDKMIALQKEWKKIGPVPRKHSESTWKRFIKACDYFFEQKNKNVVSQKSVEQTNLAAKKEVIEKIKAIDEALNPDDAIAKLKEYMAEWNNIGFVPFREKDKIYKAFHEVVDSQFDRLKVDKNDRKMEAFRSNLSDITGGEQGKGRLYGERDKLMRVYERMKSELQTYENNIGFLSVSSKGGGGLLKEMERKIEKLKDDMALIIKKIEAIDENLE